MICKKRMYLAVLICLVLMLALGSPMSAIEQVIPESLAESAINPSPMFVYINRISTSMSIQTNGLATATGSLTGYQGITDEVWIYLYLEAYFNGSWVICDSWSQTFYSYRGVLQGSSYISHGTNYRVRGSYYAWDGGDYEHAIGYSGVQYY